MNSDKKGGSISITNNSSIEGETKITIIAENGVGRKVKTIEAFYEDFHFVHQAEWCPWNEIDERIDGKTEVELDFDVELSREFVLVMNKVDKNITTSISEDAKEWLFAETKTNATTHFGRLSVAEGQIGISLSKNSEDKYRTGVITITSSKGKQLKITIHQIGEKMPNSMRSNLMAFYNACNGVNWDDNTGWGTKTEIVDWYGIKCMGYVKGNNNKVYSGLYDEWDIEMESNNISGTIPEAFWNIVNKFQTIDLGYNKFAEQKLDERIWQSHLRKLNLADCFAFTGSISNKISNCKNLYYLELRDNKLTGNIPDEIYSCKELYWLSLGNGYAASEKYDNYNNYNCSISSKITNLQKLERCDLEACNINGELPSGIYRMDNWIIGNISKDIQYTKKGRFIAICANCISGTIPEEVGKTDLDLSAITCENHLSGYLPEAARYMKTGWNRSYLHGSAGQMKPNAPKHYEGDGTAHAFSEVCEFMPMPDWAKERFGISEWNYIEQKKPKYPYADDLQYPANEYYYDGKDWRHPKYEHPARFYHKVNGEWTYDPDWNWNHTTDPPITEVPEWPGVNR